MPNRQISELNDSQTEAFIKIGGMSHRMFPSCFKFSHLTYLDQSRGSKNI